MNRQMSSMERVLTTLDYKEPDRVPLFLMLTCHGAKELDMPIKEYFSKADNIVKGQLLMLNKYKHDCLNPLFYGAIEAEAFGCEILYSDDGPPNAGEPFIKNEKDILELEVPSIQNTKCLLKGLEAIEALRREVGMEVPILSTVMSPFTLPIMQMGFGKYIELVYEQPQLFQHLMRVNEAFCVQWANAQLAAGATAVACSDPMATTLITPKELYREMGFPVSMKTMKQINGEIAMGFASAPCEPIIDEIIELGAKAVVVGAGEDIGKVKLAAKSKLTVIGNLNYLEAVHWDRKEVENQVKNIIRKAGRGGGLIISDVAGEVPFQMRESTLLEISECVRTWGEYPLDWIE